MMSRDPNQDIKVSVPSLDPMLQLGLLMSLLIVSLKRFGEWLSTAGHWFIKKDEREIALQEKLIENQQKTIDQLIQVLSQKMQD